MKEAAREGGAQLIAEDLGVIPPFVRASLARLAVPGWEVIRVEKDPVGGKEAFRDPAGYAPLSVACFGTHDMDRWQRGGRGSADKERAAVKALPGLAEHAKELGATFTPAVHRALLGAQGGGALPAARHPGDEGPDQHAGDGGGAQLDVPPAQRRWTSCGRTQGVFKLTEMVRRSVEKGGR